MSEKRFKVYKDEVREFESNHIWGVKNDIVCLEPYMTFKEADKCCDLLNELSEEKEYFERKKEYFLNKWSIVHLKNIQLRHENKELKKENEQLHYELQQIKEYLQTKIDECKNHKKMKEIVFGVEQAVGYEKALLQIQKGIEKRIGNI